jgi:anti-anti-sigma factor
MPLDVAIADHGIEGRRVTLTGRLDTETTPLLDACLAPVLAAPTVTTLVFDLAALAGIRALVKARKALEGRGGRVMVAHVQPAVRKVFDIVRALPAASIFASDAELDAYLDAMQRRVRRDP